ncbi:MAG TPA: hypothetical protein VGN41_08685 [Streptosporangiaceae bacterium]
MPASASHTTDTQAAELTALEKLAGELSARGYQAHLSTPPGGLPHLNVCNPRASILTEQVYAQAGCYWFSWAERIAPCDEPATAATILARVLRAVGELDAVADPGPRAMTAGYRVSPPPPPASVQAAALRAAFPGYIINVISRRGGKPRFEAVSRDGGSPWCLISTDAREIWRELRNR